MMTHGDWYKSVYQGTMGVKIPDRRSDSRPSEMQSKKQKMKHQQELMYWKKMYQSAKDSK